MFDPLRSLCHAHSAILAPLAGVSDSPFRRICQESGAGLTYVEMLSATAICYDNPRTLAMMQTHPEEGPVGVQITSRSPDEMARAAEVAGRHRFHSLDINMGCPVRKVVQAGCGSAILRDPARVYATTRAAVTACDLPVSVKIRLGWDHTSLNWAEVSDAAARAGAAWICIHGRTRSDDYSVPAQLEPTKVCAERLGIPVLGNGDLFTLADYRSLLARSTVQGGMISRGALGNPWLFRQIRSGSEQPESLSTWLDTVQRHCQYQQEWYGDAPVGVLMMRKHLIWYLSGWRGIKALKAEAQQVDRFSAISRLLERVANQLSASGQTLRPGPGSRLAASFVPSADMDRTVDRGVSQIGYASAPLPEARREAEQHLTPWREEDRPCS